MSENELRTKTPPRLLTVLLAIAMSMAACGGDGPGETSAQEPDVEAAGEGTTQYPLTVTNCGADVTFEAAPERVLILGRPDLFQVLYSLGVADTVVSRAGVFPAAYYDEDAAATIEAVPSLGADLDSSGHLQLSRESILDTDPDLVIGLPAGVDRSGLDDEGIPLMQQPANCPDGIADSGYDDIYELVTTFGDIFDRPERATELNAELADRIAAVEDAAGEIGGGRSIAILYPTVGGGTTYAYGNTSMVHEQVSTAGFENVFADTDERVFEVTGEELIARNPDVLLVLYSDGDPQDVVDAVTDLPGADGITAVIDEAIIPQLFSFSEFASPLIVDGLELMVTEYGGTT